MKPGNILLGLLALGGVGAGVWYAWKRRASTMALVHSAGASMGGTVGAAIETASGMLSEHFALSELVRSEDRANLDPGIRANLEALAVHVLEPLRALWGNAPVKVNSGYRSPEHNAAIGGATHSQHMDGEAADIRPSAMDGEAAFKLLVAEVKAGRLAVDQAIIYASGFIHVSYTAGKNRNELLRSYATGGSGGPYVPYTA